MQVESSKGRVVPGSLLAGVQQRVNDALEFYFPGLLSDDRKDAIHEANRKKAGSLAAM